MEKQKIFFATRGGDKQLLDVATHHAVYAEIDRAVFYVFQNEKVLI